MKLIPDWCRVLRYAWSIRLMILAGVLSGGEFILPFVQEMLPIPRGMFAGLSFVTVAGAFVARLLAQQSVSGGNDGK